MGGPFVPVPTFEECAAPTLQCLDLRAQSTKKVDGGPVNAQEWYCTNQAKHRSGKYVLNKPTNNFLLRLPPLCCSECRCVNPAGYSWAITDCTLRRVPLDSLIRDQGEHGTCVAQAFLAAMDLMRRIQYAFAFGSYSGQQLSVTDLFGKFSAIFKTIFGKETGPAHHLRYYRRNCVVSIAQKYGVAYETPRLVKGYEQSGEPYACQKMGKVFRLADDNNIERIELIVRLIAGGHPLISGVPVGRTFMFLNGDEIYDAPPNFPRNHCVVLIGSGVKDYPGNPTPQNLVSRASWPCGRGPRIYLRARGSWSDDAHPRSSLDGKGGDFNIWADQVTDVWGFHLLFD